MAGRNVTAESGASSVEVNVNAKGEPSYKVKVYEGSTQEGLDDIATQAVATMAKLRGQAYGAV